MNPWLHSSGVNVAAKREFAWTDLLLRYRARVDWPARCAVVIPCHNEEAALQPLLDKVVQFLPKVFVVDDGSSDGTAAAARTAGAFVLVHERQLGKGAALQTGLKHALQTGFAWAITLDGDGQHDPSEIPLFLRKAEAEPIDLLVGNRMGQSWQMPWLRRWINRWMSLRLEKLTGAELPDSQCGFRLIRLSAWARLPIRSRHYEIESELLVAMLRAGHRVDFVPIQCKYLREKSGIHPIVDSWRWLKWYWQA